MSAFDWMNRMLFVATSRTKRSADFIALLEFLIGSTVRRPT